MDKSHYPSNWKAISLRIRERDGWKCRQCGVANKAYGARDCHGEWHDEDAIHHMNSTDGMLLFGEFPDMIRIVLTVAHYPDPDPQNCEDSNLQSLCQRCHNRLDAPMRARHAAATRRQRRTRDQMSLWDQQEERAR